MEVDVAMGVYTSSTCAECGDTKKGPRIATADRGVLCSDCHLFGKMDPLTRHFCPDWDGMAIDKRSPEYECCTCAKDN